MRAFPSALLLTLLLACDADDGAARTDATDASVSDAAAVDADSRCGVAPEGGATCPAACGPGAGNDMARCCQELTVPDCYVCAPVDGGDAWLLAAIDCF